MQQLHPFEQKLQPGEVLLWMGRPDKQVYTSASTEWHNFARVCAVAAISLTAAVIGIFYGSDLFERIYECGVANCCAYNHFHVIVASGLSTSQLVRFL